MSFPIIKFNTHTFKQDFVYPENVAFPFGGEGQPQYVLLELHYDNPEMLSGTYMYVREINEDNIIGMAKVPKTFETRWWYICRQFRDVGKKQSV